MSFPEHPPQTDGSSAQGPSAGTARLAPFDPAYLPPWLLRTVAGLAVVASLLGRGIAPALPGTAAGIAPLIDAVQVVADVTSVNLFLLSALLTVWLAVASLMAAELPASYRVGVLPASATVVALAIVALIAEIDPRWLVWMGVVSGALAFVAVPRALATRGSRATGLVLLLVGLTAFVQVLARLLAVRASDDALTVLFGYARTISTLGFVLHLGTLATVGLWLARRRFVLLGVVAGGTLLVSMLGAWAGAVGTAVDATAVEVLAARVFDELTRHPTPYVPDFVRHAADVATVLVALLVVGARRRPSLLVAATTLALLASGNADIPLCAVMLTLAALLGPIAAATETDGLEVGRPATPESPAAAPPREPELTREVSPEALGAALALPARDGAASDELVSGGGALTGESDAPVPLVRDPERDTDEPPPGG